MTCGIMHSALDTVVRLMRTETDALGFIPIPDLKARWMRKGRFLIATNRFGTPAGYLLHSPVHSDGLVNINQVCIAADDRRRTLATAITRKLLAKLRRQGAKRLRLRCAADLDAVAFWLSLGFILTSQSEGGKRRKRLIYEFQLPIPSNTAFQIRFSRPFSPTVDLQDLRSK